MPLGPVNGRPVSASVSPGCSPIITRSDCPGPNPPTLRVNGPSGHPLQRGPSSDRRLTRPARVPERNSLEILAGVELCEEVVDVVKYFSVTEQRVRRVTDVGYGYFASQCIP